MAKNKGLTVAKKSKTDKIIAARTIPARTERPRFRIEPDNKFGLGDEIELVLRVKKKTGSWSEVETLAYKPTEATTNGKTLAVVAEIQVVEVEE